MIVIAPVGNIATEAELNAFNCLEEAITGDGVITFIATKLPEIDFSVAIKGAIGGSGEAPSADLTELENRVAALENKVVESGKDVVIPLLLDNWVEEENIFVQNITVDGLSGDIVPLIALSTVGEIATDDENYSYACISDVVVTEGNIKFIASEKPTISFTVIAKGVSANENNVAADITALVGRVSELESEVEQINNDIAPKKEWCIGLDPYGKKIYQRQITIYPELPNSNELTTTNLKHGIQNIREIVDCRVSAFKGDVNLPLPYFRADNLTVHTFIRSINNSEIELRHQGDWSGWYIFAIVTYTKTTD